MDFGVFNLLQHRDPRATPQQIVAEALEHVQLAEELGFGRVWFAEHHFSNYSLCPSPMIMCAQAAAMTKRVRVGSAVLILPLHTPARVIAEIALVDTLSGGRLDVGVGSGYQQYEFQRLGADIQKNKLVFNEMLDMIDRGLRRPTFSYRGAHFDQPQTAINVTPVQQPRPPIWVVGQSKESIISRYWLSMPKKFSVATDDVKIHGAVISVDERTGRANRIVRLQKEFQQSQ